MKIIDQSIFGDLQKPKKDSHKGQNGRLLIIAGSEKFHGALLLAVQTASRIVDMVYVYTTPNNRGIIDNLKSDVAVFIPVLEEELWNTVDMVDAVLIGPGMAETGENVGLVKTLLTKYEDKKIVIDATAMWHLNPAWINNNTILTPHSREFEQVYKCKPTSDHVHTMAIEYGGTVLLKGKYDYVSNGEDIWENRTGNVGMTKGGTGDVVSGTVAALSCTNDNITATCVGIHLAGLAGDESYEKKGTFYNAEDLVEQMGNIWKKFIK
ncbi:NAD(P)H-hydrate dehydratase [Candidatus Parcubacteria bacterium]|jgi:ADP-dependent NAD(P)H-hydrate dehydratase / NAD(P)H-hydrate epimerase|nr:NAD(P)H-hydrate dehydratase [Candidatus Parcubacteria bacterium]MBT3949260.1 NAD(P)H-hydrate dehydratase [Candidatus Parcubacteria bacterium]